jgi:hypothetical protein
MRVVGTTTLPGHPAADYGRTVLARYENTGVRAIASIVGLGCSSE